MRDESGGHVVVSGAGSWQEGGRVVWHGYWQLFARHDDQTLSFICRGRTDDLPGSRADAADAGRKAGQAALAAMAARPCDHVVAA